jgi:N-methylhydantoinase A/oxoprolinase/acetone carboxylase beta subunit
MPRVLVPRWPGVLCALGAAGADLTSTRTRSLLRPLDAGSVEGITRALEAAQAEAEGDLAGAGEIKVTRALDLRYAGQSYELTLPFEGDATQAVEAARAAVEALHRARFGHADPTAVVEVVNVRVTARERARAHVASAALAAPPGGPASTARVWIEGAWRELPVHARDGLGEGALIEGPAIVTQLDATTFVAPGWRARVDGWGNLVLERA